jgi:hypothetical protein
MASLTDRANNYLNEVVDIHGFTDLNEVIFAGREGSNHPQRSNARRVMEYGDAVYNVLDQICQEVRATREDTLKDMEEYMKHLPQPTRLPDHRV